MSYDHVDPFHILNPVCDRTVTDDKITRTTTTRANESFCCSEVPLEWGFKFFNSTSEKKTFDKARFLEFNLKNLEEFENELESKFASVHLLGRDDGGSGTSDARPDSRNFKSLGDSLLCVVYDFPWSRPDITSPVKQSRRKKNSDLMQTMDASDPRNKRQNFVFVIAECPGSAEELALAAKADVDNIDAPAVLKSFLPQHVQIESSKSLGLRIYWINVCMPDLQVFRHLCLLTSLWLYCLYLYFL